MLETIQIWFGGGLLRRKMIATGDIPLLNAAAVERFLLARSKGESIIRLSAAKPMTINTPAEADLCAF